MEALEPLPIAMGCCAGEESAEAKNAEAKSAVRWEWFMGDTCAEWRSFAIRVNFFVPQVRRTGVCASRLQQQGAHFGVQIVGEGFAVAGAV